MEAHAALTESSRAQPRAVSCPEGLGRPDPAAPAGCPPRPLKTHSHQQTAGSGVLQTQEPRAAPPPGFLSSPKPLHPRPQQGQSPSYRGRAEGRGCEAPPELTGQAGAVALNPTPTPKGYSLSSPCSHETGGGGGFPPHGRKDPDPEGVIERDQRARDQETEPGRWGRGGGAGRKGTCSRKGTVRSQRRGVMGAWSPAAAAARLMGARESTHLPHDGGSGARRPDRRTWGPAGPRCWAPPRAGCTLLAPAPTPLPPTWHRGSVFGQSPGHHPTQVFLIVSALAGAL